MSSAAVCLVNTRQSAHWIQIADTNCTQRRATVAR